MLSSPLTRHLEHGRVIFYAGIEADGVLSHLTSIQRATPILESAAADAVRQWHYKPAACGETPTREETSISIDFWLEQYPQLGYRNPMRAFVMQDSRDPLIRSSANTALFLLAVIL